jgi:hypothetical protein
MSRVSWMPRTEIGIVIPTVVVPVLLHAWPFGPWMGAAKATDSGAVTSSPKSRTIVESLSNIMEYRMGNLLSKSLVIAVATLVQTTKPFTILCLSVSGASLIALLLVNSSAVAADPRHPLRLREPNPSVVDGGGQGPPYFTLRTSTDCIQSSVTRRNGAGFFHSLV